MTISGTIHLDDDSNERYQFIYGSIFSGNFIGLYAKFEIRQSSLIKIELKIINYTKGANYLIEKAYLKSGDSDGYSMRDGSEVTVKGYPVRPIHCITLKVDITNSGNGSEIYPIDNINQKLQLNSYLEVLREEDDGDAIDEKFLEPSAECKMVTLKDGSPGLICPRGYSKIIL